MKRLSIAKQPPRAPRKTRPDLMANGRATRASSSGSAMTKAPMMKAENIVTDLGTTFFWLIRPESVLDSTDSVFITQVILVF